MYICCTAASVCPYTNYSAGGVYKVIDTGAFDVIPNKKDNQNSRAKYNPYQNFTFHRGLSNLSAALSFLEVTIE